MIDSLQLTHFFSVLKEKKKSYQENYKYFAPRLAPKFNIFNFVRRDENALSYIISNLLDPNGDHEQGEAFLKLFVETLEVKIGKDKNAKLSSLSDKLKHAKCVTESSTEKQRRIDLVIDFGDFGIGIENKPWAFDQENQLLDYSKELSNRYTTNSNGDFILIYLTGGDWAVSEYTIPKKNLEELNLKGRFLQITYSDIKEWLIKCEAICQADRVRNFLRDFIEYCEKQFEGKIDMSETKLIEEYLLENPSHLEIALNVANALPKIKDNILYRFLENLKAKFSESKSELSVEVDNNFSLDKPFINFKKSEWKDHQITIMIYNSGWNYGVRKQNVEVGYLSNNEIEFFREKLNAKLYSHGKGWISSFLLYFDEPYKTWHTNNEELSKVTEGMFGLVEAYYNAVISLDEIITENNIKM